MFTRDLHSPLMEVASGVAGLRHIMVNCYFIDLPEDESGRTRWVLVDTCLPGAASLIRRHAEERYGQGARPELIVLTHAHFDHTGSVDALSREWDVPVYVHAMEVPFLAGQMSYAPPDPWVGGSLSLTSPLYPRGPIDISDRLHVLPWDGTIPKMPGWRWIATPGHSPGHVSLYRQQDRVLIAGDAFVTTKQESLLSVLTQQQAVYGPPAYFTHDWRSARDSVIALAGMDANVAATGHGTPMRGEELRQQLNHLAEHFDELAVPRGGRYVDDPVVYYADEARKKVPPRRPMPTSVWLAAGGAALGLLLLSRLKTHDRE
jgi:glyoxylase-like metal-dependent hydrolase (beta-lactamase superfamily II)